MRRISLRLLWIFALLTLLLIVVFLQKEDLLVHTPVPIVSTSVGTPICVIPNLDPMDPSIVKFIEVEQPLDCGNGTQQIIHSNLTSLWVTDSNFTSCCYQKIEFYGNDNFRYNDDCVMFPPDGMTADPDVEFVRVTCNSSQAVSIRDFHAFVPLKGEVETHSTASSETKLSVLMLGLDSISRLNFHRQMPLTLQLLRRLGAVEMLGYNKVGDNTFPNMVPVLAGLSESELKKTCWTSTFDNCPFIWKNFSNAGYRTLFMEDIPYIGLFNFEKKGFKKPPTDYYLRPFMKALDEGIGHHGLETSNRCAGARLQIEILLEYVEKFVTTFTHDLYWGLVWSTSLSHDSINAPQLIDPVMYDTLYRLYSQNVFNNTIVVLLSDHGSRIGEIRETFQGHLEERLPFLFFLFPEWFRKRYSSQIDVLRTNAKLLTSPYDLHETMMDLLHLSTLGSLTPKERGRSLLGPVPVPLERTCEHAGISDHWCTCYKSSFVATNSAEAAEVAKTLVSYINNMLEPFHPQCAKLKLERVLGIRAWQHQMKTKRSRRIAKDYLITMETSPGGALFEATVVDHGHDLEVQRDDISRINRYGNQSACIHNFHMKLFCYCV